MPLEIRELHIKVNVNESPAGGVSTQPPPAGDPSRGNEKEQLLRDCIDEVMQLLQNTRER